MRTYTFNDPAPLNLLSTFWIDGAKISRALPGKFNTNGNGFLPDTPPEAYVAAHTAIATEAKTRGDLIYFDNEAVPDVTTLQACIAAVDAVCPAIKKCSYLPFPGPGYREIAIALANTGPTTAATQAMDVWLRTTGKAFYARLDYVDCGAYMLGPAYVDRDLKYIAALSKLAKKYLPDKLRLYSVWGCFDADFNPGKPVLPPDVMGAYVKAVRKYGDASIVFDATVGRDETFVSMLMA